MKKAFQLQVYNKEMSKIEMPFIVIEMIKQQDFFIVNHLIDK